jgi:hypothetical protein
MHTSLGAQVADLLVRVGGGASRGHTVRRALLGERRKARTAGIRPEIAPAATAIPPVGPPCRSAPTSATATHIESGRDDGFREAPSLLEETVAMLRSADR